MKQFLLRSLRRWSQQKYIFFHFNATFTTPWLWKRNNDFSTYRCYVHYAMILTKKYFFCCCYYAHYAMIMTRKNKLFFIPTLLSLCNYHEDKILFCHCYYVHHAMITIRNKLIFIPTLLSLLNCHEKNTAVLFPSGSPVFLKDSCMIQ